MERNLPQIIDGTMITTARDCWRKFFYNYILRKDSPDFRLPLTAGGAFSAGIEEYRRAFYVDKLTHPECMRRAAIVALLHWGEPDPFPLQFGSPHLVEARSLDRVIYTIHRYFKNYPCGIDKLQPKPLLHEDGLSFEFSFAIPLDPADGFPLHPSGEPYIFAGRLDTLGHYTHLEVFSDEKTTAAIGPKWAKQWPMRNQFIGYRWALRTLGYNAERCLIRGISIQKTQIKFSEHLQHYPDYLVDNWEIDLKSTLRDMNRYWEEKRFPMAIGNACTAFGNCPYEKVCLAPPEARMSVLKSYDKNTWQPGEPHAEHKVISLLKEYRLW